MATQQTDDATETASLTTIVCDALAYERLPPYRVWTTATWAVADTVKRVEPEAGRRVNLEAPDA